MAVEVCKIKYIDAYYATRDSKNSFGVSRTCEAYGYVEKTEKDVIVYFIQKIEKDTPGVILRGLMIPHTNLFSYVKTFDPTSITDTLCFSERIEVTWRSVTFVNNIVWQEAPTMRTRGVLVNINDDHIVISDPETSRIFPEPETLHPSIKPKFYYIPLASILSVKQKTNT